MKKPKYEYRQYWSEEVKERHKMRVWSDIRAARSALPLFCRFLAVYVPVWEAVLD